MLIVLHIPLGILIAYVQIAGDLLLLEAPLGQLLAAGREHTALQIVHEYEP